MNRAEVRARARAARRPAVTRQTVFDAAQELVRAGDGLRQAVLAGNAAQSHFDRVHTAEQAWIELRRVERAAV